jgi:hypothetical protein
MPQQQALPAWVVLNASNDTSASGMADQYTGFPYNAGGLNLGDYFDLTSQEAFRNCKPSVATLYAGRYRRIQVDSGATAANVKTGTIGLLASQAAASQDIGNIGGALPVSMNIVTSFDKAIGSATSVRPVVFLNSITPGNFGWVQELGVASVLGKSTLTNTTPLAGDIVISTTGGLVDDPTQSTTLTYTLYAQIIGVAFDIPINGSTGKLWRILLDAVPVVQD